MKRIIQRACFLAATGIAVSTANLSEAIAANDWQLTLAPYAWLSGVSGKVATTPPLPPVNLDMEFSDVLDKIDGAFFLAGGVRKDRFVLIADFVYSDLKTDDPYSGLLFNGVKTRQKNILIGTMAGYRVIDDAAYKFDVTVGARYWNIKSNLTLTSSVIADRKIDNEEDWVDPIAGLRFLVPLGEKWQIGATSSIGGVIAGANLEWDIFATVQYRIADWVSVGAGYRYLSVDYDNNDYIYDVDQYGPVIGVALRF